VVGVGVRLTVWWCHGRVGVVGGCVVLPEYTRIETLIYRVLCCCEGFSELPRVFGTGSWHQERRQDWWRMRREIKSKKYKEITDRGVPDPPILLPQCFFVA
jgi:hypothetical protein